MHLLKFLRQKTEGRRKIFSAFALVSLIRHHHHKSLICRSAHIKKFENRDFNQTDYIVGLHSCVEYVCPHKVCSQSLVRAIIFYLANLWDEFLKNTSAWKVEKWLLNSRKNKIFCSIWCFLQILALQSKRSVSGHTWFIFTFISLKEKHSCCFTHPAIDSNTIPAWDLLYKMA